MTCRQKYYRNSFCFAGISTCLRSRGNWSLNTARIGTSARSAASSICVNTETRTSVFSVGIDKTAGHKPDSVYPVKTGTPVIYLDPRLPGGSIRLPASSDVQPSFAGLYGVSPHRVYLISLQPNCTCFLLHWSAPRYRGGRVLPAMPYCGVRTFLPDRKAGATG